ncbi:hypothetical protein KHP57_02095 [Algiphilus sp. NNCM1]|uniref:leucine zipper domain-containing protein n=1 Tax=Algiphilus sp. TaxID=1872431 RepID=UPI001CA60A71|nr:hypothetical protein [Algiphilus acroporae]
MLQSSSIAATLFGPPTKCQTLVWLCMAKGAFSKGCSSEPGAHADWCQRPSAQGAARMNTRENARLTLHGRTLLVRRTLEHGLSHVSLNGQPRVSQPAPASREQAGGPTPQPDGTSSASRASRARLRSTPQR